MNTPKNDKVLKEFGSHLQQLRKEKELSIRKLADIADMDFSYLHRIEKGESNPTLTTLLALAEALEIDICELVSYNNRL